VFDVGVIFCNFTKGDNLYNNPENIDVVRNKLK
jgi:hypothetical protein